VGLKNNPCLPLPLATLFLAGNYTLIRAFHAATPPIEPDKNQPGTTTVSTGEATMELDLQLLRHLITKRTEEIERRVAGTGYLARTVIGVGTFLLDNEGDLDLLTAKQKVTFDKFLQPLLEEFPRLR